MSFELLIQRFTRDLARLGAAVIADPVQEKPARIRVVANDQVTECLVFLWNITPGGGRSNSRPATERRIQVTAADRFTLEVGRRTIIGGWSAETGAWGFWDVTRHAQFSMNSPSFQMRVQTLERGFHDGVATQSRRTDPPEIVVAVNPDFLLWYVQDGAVLHNSGADALDIAPLIRMDSTPEVERAFLDESTDADQATRRYTLVQTTRAIRDARFRPAVLQAYRHQCAVCPIALNLVDAAHIIPVSRPGSTDDVTNGLALCRLHHAAYDSGLLGVRSDYSILVNPQAVERLEVIGFHAGLEEFRALLVQTLRIPRSREVRPLPANLRRGMEERNWPSDLVG